MTAPTPDLTACTWRVGGHWGRTVVAEGHGPPDGQGRRDGDQLVGVMDTPALARHVTDTHNATLVRHTPQQGGTT